MAPQIKQRCGIPETTFSLSQLTCCLSAPSSLQQDPFVFSDDEDDEVSFGYAQRTKFKIHIKSKEELDKEGNPAAAGSTGASAAELRGAVSKLKLGPPGTPGGSFKDAFGKTPSKLGESARYGVVAVCFVRCCCCHYGLCAWLLMVAVCSSV